RPQHQLMADDLGIGWGFLASETGKTRDSHDFLSASGALGLNIGRLGQRQKYAICARASSTISRRSSSLYRTTLPSGSRNSLIAVFSSTSRLCRAVSQCALRSSSSAAAGVGSPVVLVLRSSWIGTSSASWPTGGVEP